MKCDRKMFTAGEMNEGHMVLFDLLIELSEKYMYNECV